MRLNVLHRIHPGNDNHAGGGWVVVVEKEFNCSPLRGVLIDLCVIEIEIGPPPTPPLIHSSHRSIQETQAFYPTHTHKDSHTQLRENWSSATIVIGEQATMPVLANPLCHVSPLPPFILPWLLLNEREKNTHDNDNEDALASASFSPSCVSRNLFEFIIVIICIFERAADLLSYVCDVSLLFASPCLSLLVVVCYLVIVFSFEYCLCESIVWVCDSLL